MMSVNDWLGVLIFIVWVLYSVFQFVAARKRAAARSREIEAERQRKKRTASGQSDDEEPTLEAVDLDQQTLLEDAETSAKNAPYRPVGRGRDMEVSSSDLNDYLKAVFGEDMIEVEEPTPQAQTSTEDESISLHEYLERQEREEGEESESEKQKTREKRIAPPAVSKQVMPFASRRTPSRRHQRIQPFAGGLVNAVIAREILDKPLAIRKTRR